MKTKTRTLTDFRKFAEGFFGREADSFIGLGKSSKQDILNQRTVTIAAMVDVFHRRTLQDVTDVFKLASSSSVHRAAKKCRRESCNDKRFVTAKRNLIAIWRKQA